MSCENCGPKTGQSVAGQIVSKAAHGAVAIVKTVAGVGLAPSSVVAERREKCRACEKKAMGFCEVCFCIIAIKTARIEEKCPDNPAKW
jgi:hypothetical protein